MCLRLDVSGSLTNKALLFDVCGIVRGTTNVIQYVVEYIDLDNSSL